MLVLACKQKKNSSVELHDKLSTPVGSEVENNF